VPICDNCGMGLPVGYDYCFKCGYPVRGLPPEGPIVGGVGGGGGRPPPPPPAFASQSFASQSRRALTNPRTASASATRNSATDRPRTR